MRFGILVDCDPSEFNGEYWKEKAGKILYSYVDNGFIFKTRKSAEKGVKEAIELNKVHIECFKRMLEDRIQKYESLKNEDKDEYCKWYHHTIEEDKLDINEAIEDQKTAQTKYRIVEKI